ncbi:hypothetical protein JTE90_009021 [Oedothorax gibbosus]|uniref:UNC93-like protein n=1 Tax=Oedothorax gibbosus TaxID=931172 RepID=A0AAV6VJH0_9ARAC|nr:hypothetical protein JTE90_009021 [Oedothorax gibbosus]
MEKESSLSTSRLIRTPLKFGKLRIIKNLVVMSTSMMLTSTAYDGLSMLQSTLNQEKGTASQAMVYTAQCLSSLILPKYVVKRFGCKVVFVISAALSLPYIAANFYPKWSTLVFTAIFMGVAISLIVASQTSYFNECVLLYCCSDSTAKENNSDYDSCIRGETSSKEVVLKCVGEDHKNNPDLGNIESKFNIQNAETLNQKDSANHVTLGIQHERNEPRRTIDFQQQNIEFVTARFFGANGLAFHSAQLWSNLISYYALQKGDAFSEKPFCVCGATLCRTETACFAEESHAGTDDTYILTGISMGTAVLALLLGMFLLDPLGTEKDPSVKFSLDNLLATFRQCKQKAQLCLVPISLYVGMLQGFYTADFTKSYIACALGPSRVGLVTAVYGLSCALSSPLAGFLVKYTGRIPVFLLMQSVNLSVLLYLLLWSPNSDDLMKFYAVACLLGVVTGTQWSQIPAFHGILFKKEQEAAFASYYFFNALGWSLSFACSGLLCTSVKLYVLLVVSGLGIVGYLTAERTYHKSTKPMPLE